jgi:hypothetical protein
MTFLNKIKGKNPIKPTLLCAINPRPKGLILQGEDWDYFCWNESSLAKSLEIALEKWIGAGELPYLVFLVPIDPKDRNTKVRIQKLPLEDCSNDRKPIVWNLVGDKYVSNYLVGEQDEEVITDW